MGKRCWVQIGIVHKKCGALRGKAGKVGPFLTFLYCNCKVGVHLAPKIFVALIYQCFVFFFHFFNKDSVANLSFKQVFIYINIEDKVSIAMLILSENWVKICECRGICETSHLILIERKI